LTELEKDHSEEEELFEHYAFTADPKQEFMRIDRWLMHKIANASRTKIQAGISAGCVLVNEKTVKSNYKIKPADHVRVVLPEEPRDTEIYPENIPLDIIHEDSQLVVVNKPAGMVVHPGFNNYTGTLVHALVYHFGELPEKGQYHRPGLIHRIDKDTSGLLVVGKTDEALTHLGKQFFDHSIERKYLALVWGELAEDEGTIRGYLAPWLSVSLRRAERTRLEHIFRTLVIRCFPMKCMEGEKFAKEQTSQSSNSSLPMDSSSFQNKPCTPRY
jgi:23S rRNA pseudouridine1911/1915/1917 synthase